jgi:hypothetical protein
MKILLLLAAVFGQVRLEDNVECEGQASYRIATPAATYFYHEQGAGFARMIDPAGNDWINYHPHGGSDGKYRGIPNLVHPEGYFHPGGTGCRSRIARQTAKLAVIESESEDGQWAVRWEIGERKAVLHVLKAPKPYWFLYEGDMAGRFDPPNQWMTPSGRPRITASERWDADIPGDKGVEWIRFDSPNTPWMLFLAHHTDDNAVDSYWPMNGQMTVFGFGRLKLEKHLTGAPQRFTIGFARSAREARKRIFE